MSFIDKSTKFYWENSVFLFNFLSAVAVCSLILLIFLVIKRVMKKNSSKSIWIGICVSLSLIIICSGSFYYLFFNNFEFNNVDLELIDYLFVFENNGEVNNKIVLSDTEKKQIHSMFINLKFNLTASRRTSWQTSDDIIHLWVFETNHNKDSIDIMLVLDQGEVIAYSPSRDCNIEIVNDTSDLYELLFMILTKER